MTGYQLTPFEQWSFLAGHLVAQCQAHRLRGINTTELFAEAATARITSKTMPDIGAPTRAVQMLIDVMTQTVTSSKAREKWGLALFFICDAVKAEFRLRPPSSLEDDCQMPAGALQ